MLAIGYYVGGGLIALFSLIPLIHVTFGLMFIFGDDSWLRDGQGDVPPPIFGWLFVVIGGFFIVLGELLAIFVILTGRYIKERRNYLFCFVVGCVACAFVPLGTILGVFTIIVLSRESVKALFGRAIAPQLA